MVETPVSSTTTIELEVQPEGKVSINLSTTALLIIDMQRDFLEPNGFGEMLGNDVSKLQRAVEPIKKVLTTVRNESNSSNPLLLVIHTREGHRPDLKDVHSHKQRNGAVIGSKGPMGKILIRGEPGHDIIEELYPIPGEPIVDKPGKGSFYATDLDCILSAQGITTLLVCGVTTEVCVHTTVREANDRGYQCIVIGDGCASYYDEFHKVALEMIIAQGGIFGSITSSEQIIKAFVEQGLVLPSS